MRAERDIASHPSARNRKFEINFPPAASRVRTLSEVPAPTNRLGVRSGGEGGTTPALAAVINAIVDALADLGVCHIERSPCWDLRSAN